MKTERKNSTILFIQKVAVKLAAYYMNARQQERKCTKVNVKLENVVKQELTWVMESPNKITFGQITVLNLDIMNFSLSAP